MLELLRRWRLWLVVGFAALLVVIVLAVTVIVVWWPRTTEVETFTQPDTVTYTDGLDPHHASLYRRYSYAEDVGLPFADEKHYLVLGAHAPAQYGHVVEVDITGSDPTDLTVEWEPDGAWITYGTGHRLFVPADSFMGTR